jgi:O-antigen ligase
LTLFILKGSADAVGSTSYRIHFVLNSLDVIKKEPILGTGVGDYPDEYSKVNALNTPKIPNTVQPHNQYIFEWASLGIFGLLTLLLIFALFIKEWLGCNDRRKNLQMGFIILFLVIMWADSYLLGRATAMLFITMAAILFSRDMILKNNQNMGKVFK